VPWHADRNVHGRKLSRASIIVADSLPRVGLRPTRGKWHGDTGGAFCISSKNRNGGGALVSRSSRKEFRTSVILTETQFMRVREIAQANDSSIAWVLRQAIDRYLVAQGVIRRGRLTPVEG
jgi:hypothetical protein